MKFKAEIDVMPHDALLDPQGKAVLSGLKNLSLTQVNDVRVGKHISLKLEANSLEEAKELTEQACLKLLANQIMENFTYTILPIE